MNCFICHKEVLGNSSFATDKEAVLGKVRHFYCIIKRRKSMFRSQQEEFEKEIAEENEEEGIPMPSLPDSEEEPPWKRE